MSYFQARSFSPDQDYIASCGVSVSACDVIVASIFFKHVSRLNTYAWLTKRCRKAVVTHAIVTASKRLYRTPLE